MKKFITKIFIFLLPVVAFAFVADSIISKGLKQNHTYTADEYSTWNNIYEGKINSEIVIYGASKAWVQINPTMIGDSLNTSAYNLGIDGHNFWLQYLRHSELLKYNKKPNLIIYSIDAFTLYKTEDLYNADQFLPYMLFNEKIKNATMSYRGYKLIDYQLPLIRYYGKKEAIYHAIKLSALPNSDTVVRIKGYKPRDEQWNSDFDKVKDKMSAFEVKLDTPSIILFEKYLNECNTKKIKIIFVYAPEYIEGQKFISNRDEIIKLYRKFSNQYNIPFYDFSNDTMVFQKKYFYNALHLNKTGAEVFTKKLIEKIKSTKATWVADAQILSKKATY